MLWTRTLSLDGGIVPTVLPSSLRISDEGKNSEEGDENSLGQ